MGSNVKQYRTRYTCADDDGDRCTAQPKRMSESETMRRVTAEPGDAGARLDRVLATRLDDLSRTRVKHLVEAGHVTVDGAAVRDPAMRVKAGQSFVLTLPPAVEDRPAPQAMALTIVYEDQHLIVLDKPAGLVVHPAPGNPDQTLVNALLAHCGASLAGIGGVKRPGIVHRLDKDTSGLMVVAKDDLAQAALTADFAARRITRAYQGVVWGVPEPRAGEISGRIGRSPRDRKKMAVLRAGGKPAITRYRVLRAFKDVAALVECRLATGRTHQIRVHLSDAGHSLIGDPVYGNPRSPGRRRALSPEARTALTAFPRQALHAVLLGFRHPSTGENIEFSSNLPSDISALVDLLDHI
jgi:23S rRNA pseudouridine1911/1915/1917 synthase